MPRVALLLFLSAVAVAEDSAKTDLEAFEKVKGLLTAVTGPDKIPPAVDKLAEHGDASAVEPLARCLVETFATEDAMVETLRGVQQRHADASDRIKAIDKEVGRVGKKLEAGDHSVEADFQKLIEERKPILTTLQGLEKKQDHIERTILFLSELRTRISTSLSKILVRLEGEPLTTAFEKLRASLDIANPKQSLFFVQILRDSRKDEIAPHLIEIIDHPKVEPRVRVSAIVALGRIRTPTAYGALVRIAENDEQMRPQILHALGMAAAQHFTDLTQAKAWVEKQG